MIIRGMFNRSKSKVFLVLFNKRVNMKEPDGLGVKTMSNYSKVDYRYIRRKVKLWACWHYLKREKGPNGRYVYSILQKGINYLTRLSSAEVEELLAEIRGTND